MEGYQLDAQVECRCLEVKQCMVMVRGHSNGKETAEGRKEEKEKG